MKLVFVLGMILLAWGQQLDVQLSYIDSSLIKIEWCQGVDLDSVVVLSSKGSIYRSDDQGVNWVKMSEVFHRKGLGELENGQKDKVGIVNNMVRDGQSILFMGSESISWLSGDCGRSITALSSGGRQLREYQFHPVKRNLVLASSWTQCPKPDCLVYKELLLSENGGHSFHRVASYVNQFQWQGNRILLSMDPVGKGNQPLSTWNRDSNLYYSDDLLQTKNLLVVAGTRFLLTPSYLFVAQVTNIQTKEISLLISDPEKLQFHTIDANEKLKEHAYTVLDTQQRQVLIIVSHLKTQSPIGVIYISDSTGTRYTPSLENAVRIDNGGEFHRVQGLEGIYLSNVYHADQAKLYGDSLRQAQDNSLGYSSQSFKDEDLSKFKQSRITFDKGQTWQVLRPPVVDSLGQPIKCDPKVCQLHLHLNQAIYQFGPIYSQSSAIGLILATGSVGKYLSYRTDQVNTYMSRDGGLTWVEIHKGSHIYEISDHGGLIVMASDQQATNKLKYSWNEGLDWQVVEFGDEPIEVQNILTSQSNPTRFIIYGSSTIAQNGQSVEQGVLVTVDLDQIHQRKCIGTSNAGEADSDYELWSPSGIVNPDCLFGRKITYIRRKREAKCYNPEQFDKVLSTDPCPCTLQDYECDIGFTRDPNSYECTPTSSTAAPLDCVNYYTISSGYTKRAGDVCTAGVQFKDLRVMCPSGSSTFMDYLLYALMAYGVYWLWGNWDRVGVLLSRGNESISSQFKLPQQQQNKNEYKNDFEQVKLEDNEGGLGHREFDEDLIETEVVPQQQQMVQLQPEYDEDELI